jgi:hypothetical protein
MVPGLGTDVTPDASPTEYTDIVGPAPDGEIVAPDVLACLLATLNVQKVLRSWLPDKAGTWRCVPDEGRSLDATAWALSVNGMWVSTGATGYQVVWTFRIPAGAVLNDISVSLIGGSGHSFPIEHGPVVSICRLSAFANVAASELWNSGEDGYAVGSGYENEHRIVGNDLAISYVSGPDVEHFGIFVTNEWGTNARLGLAVARPQVRIIPAATSTLDIWG